MIFSEHFKHTMLLYKKKCGTTLSEEETMLFTEPRISKKCSKQKGDAQDLPWKKLRITTQCYRHDSIPPIRSKKDFLEHMEADMVYSQLSRHAGLIDTRLEENQREIHRGTLMASEILTATFAKNIQHREMVKFYQKDFKTLALYDFKQSRKDIK